MNPLRIFLAVIVPALFAIALGLLCRKRSKRATLIATVLGGLLGTGCGALLEYAYPAMFTHIFSRDCWLEWLPFVSAPSYLMMFLARSLFTMTVAFLVAFASTNPGWKQRSYYPAAAFVLGFGVLWAVEVPHHQLGVETRTYVYRIADLEEDRDAWLAQSDPWVKFLDWNLTPYVGYESFDFTSANAMKDRMGGEVLKGKKGTSVFVFVKEYWKDGKQAGVERVTLDGPCSAGQLRDALRNFVLNKTAAK